MADGDHKEQQGTEQQEVQVKERPIVPGMRAEVGGKGGSEKVLRLVEETATREGAAAAETYALNCAANKAQEEDPVDGYQYTKEKFDLAA